MIKIIAEILSLVGCLLFMISAKLKTQKQIMLLQTIESSVNGIANFLLGGTQGVLACIVSALRNLLAAYKKNGKIVTIGVIAILTILNIIWLPTTLVGWLPLFTSISFTIFTAQKDPKWTKAGMLVNTVCWLIYNISIQAIIYTISGSISLVLLILELRKAKEE